jgi:hemerythrin-like metal-binding protein
MLSVGVKAIDHQHKTLVGILNQLGDVVQGSADSWDESVIMSKLLEYTETHFAFEEALMRRVDYAGLEAHAQEHRRLFEQLADLMARSAAGEAVEPQALLIFLRDWLTGHILGADRQLGQDLNQIDIR